MCRIGIEVHKCGHKFGSSSKEEFFPCAQYPNHTKDEIPPLHPIVGYYRGNKTDCTPCFYAKRNLGKTYRATSLIADAGPVCRPLGDPVPYAFGAAHPALVDVLENSDIVTRFALPRDDSNSPPPRPSHPTSPQAPTRLAPQPVPTYSNPADFEHVVNWLSGSPPQDLPLFSASQHDLVRVPPEPPMRMSRREIREYEANALANPSQVVPPRMIAPETFGPTAARRQTTQQPGQPRGTPPKPTTQPSALSPYEHDLFSGWFPPNTVSAYETGTAPRDPEEVVPMEEDSSPEPDHSGSGSLNPHQYRFQGTSRDQTSSAGPSNPPHGTKRRHG